MLHIPHSATAIPADTRAELVLSDVELERELLDMTDHFTDELFSLSAAEAQSIIFPVSRLVLDPERFVDDAQEPMTQRGMGVVYALTSRGTPLRRELSEQHRAALIDRFYVPHHLALTRAVNACLEARGHCLVIDCHSFPSRPLPYELDQSPDRPQICLGTDPVHTPAWLADAARAAFEAKGFTVAINRPFAGALVPLEHYGVNRALSALMIEVNRGVYMDEQAGERLPTFARVAGEIQDVVRQLVTPEIDALRTDGEARHGVPSERLGRHGQPLLRVQNG